MQYEELQAIWETQTKRPVFAVNDFGLHMELFRTRNKARRKLFWEVVVTFVVAPVLFLGLTVPIIKFLLQGPIERFPPNKLPMTIWDVGVCLIGMGLVGFAAWSLYASRRKHENQQRVFARSLRQEIELCIAQTDFQMSMITSGLSRTVAVSINFAALILFWELGRLNNHPLPMAILWSIGAAMIGSFIAIVPAHRKAMEKGLQRKLALEALRAKLDEGFAQS